MIVNRLEKLCRICVESLVQRINAGIRLKGWLKKRERERKRKKEKKEDRLGGGGKKKRTGSDYAVCSFVDAGAICKINETRRNINATRMLLLLLLLRSPIEISLKNHPIYVDRSHRRAG